MTVFRTMERAVSGGAGSLRFRDALLVATIEENGIDTIWTEDAHFSKVLGLTAKNPFLAE